MSIFDTGVRPAIDAYLKAKSEEIRDYGEYWSASSAGYCLRKVMFDRLGVPPINGHDERKTRVFESGHIFHEWVQRITKDAGLSIAQELELQDEELMIRGHIDDLVLVDEPIVSNHKAGMVVSGNFVPKQHLILYDYKTAHSRSFHYAKDRPMSHYHRMQLGAYMYMLRSPKLHLSTILKSAEYTIIPKQLADLTEARILSISKDDLCMTEKQLFWDDQLETDVLTYWKTLNTYWKAKKFPACTCADHENGFMANPKYNPYYFEGEPCSLKYLHKWRKEQKDDTGQIHTAQNA